MEDTGQSRVSNRVTLRNSSVVLSPIHGSMDQEGEDLTGVVMYSHLPRMHHLNTELLDPDLRSGMNGERITLRPLSVDDLDLEVNFLSGLSEAALYQRVMGTVRIRSVDRVRELLTYEVGPAMALGAVIDDGEVDMDGRSVARLVGVARYAPSDRDGVAEMAIVLSDEVQGRGLGTQMLTRLHVVARGFGYREMIATTFSENRAMLRLAARLGYSARAQAGDGSVQLLHAMLLDKEAATGQCALPCDSPRYRDVMTPSAVQNAARRD